VLAILAATYGVVGWTQSQDDTRFRATIEEPRRTTTSSPVAKQPTTLRQVRPTRLTIPDIDVATSLVQLGLNADKTVEVPADPAKAGWYRLGPAPGRPGSAVILGHVDSLEGPAVFARLRTLAPGARVDVEGADGFVARFAVSKVAVYANSDFPATKVYRNGGKPVLTLVTCGGEYDRSQGGYQANVVVTAVYVGRVGSA